MSDKPDFEQYLGRVCFEANPTVLDDDMPDFYDTWISEQNDEDFVRHANAYAIEFATSQKDAEIADYLRDRIKRKFNGYGGNLGFTEYELMSWLTPTPPSAQ